MNKEVLISMVNSGKIRFIPLRRCSLCNEYIGYKFVRMYDGNSMKVICTRCGGTNIACEAIVNPNTGKIIDYLDESFMHANCGDCKEEVVITDVDRVKKDIDSMFFEFVKKNGKEPEYVECQIVWKDTGDDQRTTIKLSLSINDDDNDNVFYHCNGIESLKSLVEYGVGEFIVIDCWSFLVLIICKLMRL